MRHLIGLTGHKGSGKDEVAKILARFGYIRVAFADPLKAVAYEIGWDGSKEDLEDCPSCGMLRGRRLLQVLGSEGIRQHVADDAWIQAATKTIAPLDRVVITDVRFLNEAEFVHNAGGLVWKVIRPGYEGDAHASERELEEIEADAIVVNDSTLRDLAIAVGCALAGV